MNRSFLIAIFLLFYLESNAQLIYSLDDIILRVRQQSPNAKQAETRKKTRFWDYRLYKSNYNPQLRIFGNMPGYNRDFFANRLDDNTVVFQEREQTFSRVNLGLQQPIIASGGQISVNTDLNLNRNIPQDLNSWSSTLVNLQLIQPIFSFNQLKWDKKIEPLRYEESKKEYVEQMEFLSREAVALYFNYLDAQINQEIAKFNLSKNDTIYNIEKGRYNIGTTSRDKLLQVELQLLRSKQAVVQANLDLTTSELDIRIYVGLSHDASFVFQLPKDIPEFAISLEDALDYARQNRSGFVAFERRRLEADRQVAEAKGQRNQIDLVASYGLTSTGSTFGESYQDVQNQQRVNLQFNIPIVDWGRNKARTKSALANKQLQDYVIAQDENTFEQEITIQVHQFEVLRSQIEISQKSDEVAQERYLVAQNQYLIGKIDITNLNIALTEKDQAKRSYLSSLRDFWIAYFNLRRLTLYDFEHDELLYKEK